MQKSARLEHVAARLNNLEQKVEGLEPGGDSGLYEIVLGGSEYGAVEGGPTIYEQFGSSLFKSIFGLQTGGQPSLGALLSAQYSPFYSQVFGNLDERFIHVGDGLNVNGEPFYALSHATFGPPGNPLPFGGYSLAYVISGLNAGYVAPLQLDAGRSVPDAIFGTPAGAASVLALHGSVAAYVGYLEDRVAFLESDVESLSDEIDSIKGRLSTGGL